MSDAEVNKENPNVRISTQVFVAVTVAVGGFSMGSSLSYSSPTLPSLEESQHFSNLTLEEISWFASLSPLAALVSCPLSGYGVESIGRRGTMIFLTLPLLAGWILVGFAYNTTMLYTGRWLSGFSAAAYSMVGPIFISETASESIRGRLGIINSVGIYCGILYPYVAGYYLPYNILALTLCIVPILLFIMLMIVVESPRYLICKGDIKKATKSLVWLRRNTNVADELNLIQTAIEKNQHEKVSLKHILTTPAIMKPALLLTGLMFFQVASGIDAVIFFNYTIFKESGTNISPNLSSIAVGSIELMTMLLSICIIDKLGRRPLILISEISMLVSLSALGLFFHLKHQESLILDYISWLPLLSLLIYAFGFSIGMGPIPWVMMEIIPRHVVGAVSGFTVCFNWSLAFLVTRFFEELMFEIGGEWCFWIFAILCAIGTIFAYFLVPETKGKTLEEIQESFK